MTLKTDGPHLEEKFKSDTASVMATGGRGFNVHGAAFLPDNPRPELGSGIISRFNVPTLDEGYVWIVDDVKVEQQEAGDHCIVTVTSHAFNQGQGEPGDNGQLQQNKDHWDLRWMPYSMNVLAYCKNENGAPHWIKYIPNVNYDILKPDTSDWPEKQTAEAQYIKECAQGNSYSTKWGYLKTHQWVRHQSVYELNDHEQDIYDYYVNGYNPTFHYPVLTHTYTAKYAKDLSADWWTEDGEVKHVPEGRTIGKIDECLDLETQPLSATTCPYKFDYDWCWLKTGHSVTENNKEGEVTYTHAEEFSGFKKVIAEFYKNGNWSMIDPENPPATPWEIGER